MGSAKTLFISQYVPNIHNIGGPTRLVFDILRAAPMHEAIDFACPFEEQRPKFLPESLGFRPWSSIGHGSKRGSRGIHFYGVHKHLRPFSNCVLDANGYDCLVSYPYTMSLMRTANPPSRTVIIGMDSASLLFLRGFVIHHGPYKWACLAKFIESMDLEARASAIAYKIVTVGRADAEFYINVHGAKAEYIPHPVTDIKPSVPRRNWAGEGKLRVCFAGALNHFYAASMMDDYIRMAAMAGTELSGRVEFAFLGKGLEKQVRRLAESGYAVSHVNFVSSFEDFLADQDILVAPLAVGAGTKNRILSAIAIGIDVIGTPVAIENIEGMGDRNIANDGTDFVRQLRSRLTSGRIEVLGPQESKRFAEEHSVEKWRTGFWEDIVGD